MRVSPETNFMAVFGLATIVGVSFLLLPVTGRAQTRRRCTLAVEGSGGTGVVMVNASGCAGDVAIIAKAGSNQKQFAIGSGEVYRPFNLTPCDLGIAGDKVSVTYTAVVVSGKDKGKTSAAYSGTIEPPPTPNDDAPPGVKVSGKPSPATYVRPGDTIALTVDLTDDIGLTAVKVIDPSGAIMLDQRIKPRRLGAEAATNARPARPQHSVFPSLTQFRQIQRRHQFVSLRSRGIPPDMRQQPLPTTGPKRCGPAR